MYADVLKSAGAGVLHTSCRCRWRGVPGRRLRRLFEGTAIGLTFSFPLHFTPLSTTYPTRQSIF